MSKYRQERVLTACGQVILVVMYGIKGIHIPFKCNLLSKNKSYVEQNLLNYHYLLSNRYSGVELCKNELLLLRKVRFFNVTHVFQTA